MRNISIGKKLRRNCMSRYTATLKEDSKTVGTYQLKQEMFLTLQKNLEPFRSIQPQSKQVKCKETGIVFKNAMGAICWLAEQGKTTNYGGSTLIKQVCNGKRKTAYGYHWEWFLG